MYYRLFMCMQWDMSLCTWRSMTSFTFVLPHTDYILVIHLYACDSQINKSHPTRRKNYMAQRIWNNCAKYKLMFISRIWKRTPKKKKKYCEKATQKKIVLELDGLLFRGRIEIKNSATGKHISMGIKYIKFFKKISENLS